MKQTALLDQRLSDKEFKKISSYIESNVGIKLPITKKVMIQSRLFPRLRSLKMESFADYLNFVFDPVKGSQELIFMINAITTNKTDFFREADHFSFLTDKIIPELVDSGRRSLKLWSAGCSSGEEAYTMAIVLKEYIKNHNGALTTFSISGTDISTKVLTKAVNAVYDYESIRNLPLEIKRRYFLKSSDPRNHIVRIKPEIRAYTSFSRLNFMDPEYNMRDTFQVIFCRNVLIYFEKSNQEAIIKKLLKHLEIGGYLFLGHSETIFSMNLPLINVAPAVYKKTGSNRQL